MKVYYVAGNYDGCYYVRCLQPLKANGWAGDLMSIYAKPANREISAKKCLEADVVVFQRPDDPAKVQAMKALKAMGKKIVFDNDDTYKIDADVKLKEATQQRVKVIDDALGVADLVTTTTNFLADEYRKISDNVVVIPNCVNPNDWDEPLKNETDKIRVGFVGSVANTNDDYNHIKKTIKALNKRKDVQLVVFGMPVVSSDTKEVAKLYKKEYDFWGSLDIDWQPLVRMDQYFETLNSLRLDVMLIPRGDNYFNRCKSNIKFLEASMLEIPVVAQSFTDGLSPYDGLDIPLAVTDEDFLREVTKLIESKDLRQSIGKKSKEYVLENYNINKNAHLWANEYKKLCEL